MADVSVRFAMTNDSEIMLNLSMAQAIRLMEAIARKVGEIMPRGAGGAAVDNGRSTGATGLPNLGPYPQS